MKLNGDYAHVESISIEFYKFLSSDLTIKSALSVYRLSLTKDISLYIKQQYY